MAARPLTLVSFAAVCESEQLRETLVETGFDVCAWRGNDWLDARAARISTPLVLFLAEPNYPRDRLLDALQILSTTSLGICRAELGPLDDEIFRRCGEVAFWPCRHEELRLRLDRLIPRSTAEVLRESDEALYTEFLRLNMVGRSLAFVDALRVIRKLARCDASVLIDGETGTGKEMAARAIHYLSERRDRPFIPVNCGAIPDNLFENEMFGHARGAFTDAKEAQLGLVALAEGGTLFLDEVDTLSAKGQVALLRFLQDRQYRPLGGRETRAADVRVLAAVNADLGALAAKGEFRSDLLFRLRVLPLRLPPLRERGGDIALLAEHFLEQYRVRYGQANKRLSPEFVHWLLKQGWPGNVRELDSVVHREFVLAEADIVGLRPELCGCYERRQSIPDRRRASFPSAMGFKQYKARAIAEIEKSYLAQVLVEAQGNITAAARRAGKERRALGKLLKKYGLTPASSKPFD
jgi:DNA-binding NtrC family response regulator